MNKLAFGLILGGTLYAPVEITRCILRDMPYFPKMAENFTIELVFIWVGYVVAMIVLAVEVLGLKLGTHNQIR